MSIKTKGIISNFQFLISNKTSNAQYLKFKKFGHWILKIEHFIENWKLGIGNYFLIVSSHIFSCLIR